MSKKNEFKNRFAEMARKIESLNIEYAELWREVAELGLAEEFREMDISHFVFYDWGDIAKEFKGVGNFTIGACNTLNACSSAAVMYHNSEELMRFIEGVCLGKDHPMVKLGALRMRDNISDRSINLKVSSKIFKKRKDGK